MQKSLFGKFSAGVCKGISTRAITNRKTGEQSTIIEVGIASFRTDSFGDSVEIVEMIQLSKSLVAAGAPSKLVAYKGKHIMLPVWYNAYASKNGASMTTYLANDWETQLVVFNSELQKVG